MLSCGDTNQAPLDAYPAKHITTTVSSHKLPSFGILHRTWWLQHHFCRFDLPIAELAETADQRRCKHSPACSCSKAALSSTPECWCTQLQQRQTCGIIVFKLKELLCMHLNQSVPDAHSLKASLPMHDVQWQLLVGIRRLSRSVVYMQVFSPDCELHVRR